MNYIKNFKKAEKIVRAYNELSSEYADALHIISEYRKEKMDKEIFNEEHINRCIDFANLVYSKEESILNKIEKLAKLKEREWDLQE